MKTKQNKKTLYKCNVPLYMELCFPLVAFSYKGVYERLLSNYESLYIMIHKNKIFENEL